MITSLSMMVKWSRSMHHFPFRVIAISLQRLLPDATIIVAITIMIISCTDYIHRLTDSLKLKIATLVNLVWFILLHSEVQFYQSQLAFLPGFLSINPLGSCDLGKLLFLGVSGMMDYLSPRSRNRMLNQFERVLHTWWWSCWWWRSVSYTHLTLPTIYSV